MCRARFKPHIDDVEHLRKIFCFIRCPQKFLRRTCIPRIRAIGIESCCDTIQNRLIA